MLHELFEEKSDSKHQFRNSSGIGATTRTRTVLLLECPASSISQDTLILDSKLTLRGKEEEKKTPSSG